MPNRTDAQLAKDAPEKLYLRLSRDKMIPVQAVMAHYPGDTPVYMNLPEEGITLLCPRDMWISGPETVMLALSHDLTEENIQKMVIPTDMVLPFPVLELTSPNKDKIFNGMSVATDYPEGEYKYYRDGEFYGIAEVKRGYAKMKTKLC